MCFIVIFFSHDHQKRTRLINANKNNLLYRGFHMKTSRSAVYPSFIGERRDAIQQDMSTENGERNDDVFDAATIKLTYVLVLNYFRNV